MPIPIIPTIVAALAAWNEPTLPRPEIRCLAEAIYHESRSESALGQIAVAQVVLNRSAATSHSICTIVQSPGQFSWTSASSAAEIREIDAWTASVHLAILVFKGLVPDQTDGATHFYEWRKVNPAWASSMRQTMKTPVHRFLRPEPKAPANGTLPQMARIRP